MRGSLFCEKHKLFILGFIIILLLAFLVLAGLGGISFLVDFWWFDAQGYGLYFWKRTLYRLIVFIEIGAFFFLIFFINFWVALHYLKVEYSDDITSSVLEKNVKRLFYQLKSGSLWVYIPFFTVLSILVAWPLFQQWKAFLLYLVAPDTGIQDLIYGEDIAYYLFSFPIYALILQRLLIAFLLLLIGLTLFYWIENKLLSQCGKHLPYGVKWHLSALVLMVFFIEIGDFILQRNALVYSKNNQPLFFGPGFFEMRFILPLIWLSLFLLLGIAILFIYFIHKRNGLKLLTIFVLFFIFSLGSRYFNFLPWIVKEYIIKPNEFSLQKPFIENSIKSTLNAYNLSHLEVRNFDSQEISQSVFSVKVLNLIRNIPVWDEKLVGQVYRQIQKLRAYYSFPSVNADRYVINGNKQQVFLGARELNYRQLPSSTKKWENEHLLYTHGYGAVMTSASQGQNESIAWFIRGIPPESNDGLSIDQPEIYYGLGDYHYAIVPNKNGELDYPAGKSKVITNYQGQGGVPLSSWLKKIAFSYYLQDSKLLFNNKIEVNSKILFWRNIIERIKKITPYLILDSSPYLVVTSKGLYWIEDAYTISSGYPNSDRVALENFSLPITINKNKPINYIRNSVKIVVDAYNGTVNYYIFDSHDPIIQGYRRMYPSLFKTKAQMPADILSHVRYPKDLFKIQMDVYAKYHQTNAEVFYQQEDAWSLAKKNTGKSADHLGPYYLTSDLMAENRLDFVLFLPLITKGRDNMRAMAVAGCDEPYYGKLVIYSFPKEELVFGPSQIHTLINVNPEVSDQFTLWNKNNSKVVLGRMIIMPVGQSILYIQPVFLTFKGAVKIPQLERVIMSDGRFIAMEPTLVEAYIKLKEKVEKMG